MHTPYRRPYPTLAGACALASVLFFLVPWQPFGWTALTQVLPPLLWIAGGVCWFLSQPHLSVGRRIIQMGGSVGVLGAMMATQGMGEATLQAIVALIALVHIALGGYLVRRASSRKCQRAVDAAEATEKANYSRS